MIELSNAHNTCDNLDLVRIYFELQREFSSANPQKLRMHDSLKLIPAVVFSAQIEQKWQNNDIFWNIEALFAMAYSVCNH